MSSPHAKVSLWSSVDQIKPGESFKMGFYFEMEPEWHIYWKNPGDSGMALSVDWISEPQLKIQQPDWPVPKRISIPPLANYGYENTILIPFVVEWNSKNFNPQTKQIKITAQADWLICKVECLPAEAEFVLSIPISKQTVPSSQKNLFDDVNLPQKKIISSANFEVKTEDMVLNFLVPKELAKSTTKWDFFANQPLTIAHSDVPRWSTMGSDKDQSTIQIKIKKDPNATQDLSKLSGVIVAENVDTLDRKGFEIDFYSKGSTQSSSQKSIWLLLLFALLGGLILNIMPCVFPVLSLKVLSFVEESKQSSDQKNRLRAHGFSFTLGVLVSFWALAGLLIFFRSSGTSLGWGFQLQSPLFVCFLIGLFFVIGLNLAGFFEVNFSGGRLLRVGANSKGLVSSFWSGVLATIIATPCTAPFMGVALGAALAMPALQSLLIFSFLGLGMSLPYLILSLNPKWLGVLPRPGPWMETFKEFLSFPMFATCLWLLWVLSGQSQESVMLILILLLLLVFNIWIFKKSFSKKSKYLLLFVSSLGIGFISAKLLSAANNSQPSQSSVSLTQGQWSSFTNESFEQALKDHDFVFVDFTASWCITCQVNKITVLNLDSARIFFDQRKVHTIRADWTNRDASITKLLERIGRSSVPTYAIFSRSSDDFKILPEILSFKVLETQIEEFVNQRQTTGIIK